MDQTKKEVNGVVLEALPNTLFRVKLEDGNVLLCYLAGKMRIHYVRVMPGDRVRVETTPYDSAKGRIVYRYN